MYTGLGLSAAAMDVMGGPQDIERFRQDRKKALVDYKELYTLVNRLENCIFPLQRELAAGMVNKNRGRTRDPQIIRGEIKKLRIQRDRKKKEMRKLKSLYSL